MKYLNWLNTKKIHFNLEEDYKTVAKKFIDQGADKDEVDQYLSDFKKMKDVKIKNIDDKNIDNWGKKSWKEFKYFVDNLKNITTKSQEKKIVKSEGAKKVAENSEWVVYKITSHKACIEYGAGTKWCITQRDSTNWEEYYQENDFYFIISKTRDVDDPFYKIALQANHAGKSLYWDAIDRQYHELPHDLNIPKFEIEEPEERIEIDYKVYTISQFENLESLEVNDDLDLREYNKIKKLPKKLKVNGDLYLSDNEIISRSDYLEVKGKLNLLDNQKIKLPKVLKVGDDLNLSNTKIISLPDDLEVEGDLDLSDTEITSLPDSLEVGGVLNLSDTPITKLPKRLKVGFDLNLSNTKITTLPDDLEVERSIYLHGSEIIKLPEGLKVGDILDLSYTKITSLPDDLEVEGDLDLSDTPITELPKGLKVGGNLYLFNTKITSLPEDLEVGESIIGFEGE